MDFDPERVWLNVRQATTEDLLDRVTVYRRGMESEALEMVESELFERGISADVIEAHAKKRDTVIKDAAGVALPCSFCHRPAVAQGWGWHQLWGVIPLFPRFYSYCEKHRND